MKEGEATGLFSKASESFIQRVEGKKLLGGHMPLQQQRSEMAKLKQIKTFDLTHKALISR